MQRTPSLKNFVKKIFLFFHIYPTKNLRYDYFTKKVLRKVLQENSNCIDVGAHKGEILDLILKYAPGGQHFAFEPIPALYKNLVNTYDGQVTVHPYALSYENGKAEFSVVENAPAYSGLRKRDYGKIQPDIEKIQVEVRRLDDVIPPGIKIDLIKIDVEGAELMVLRGAQRILAEYKPVLIFEFGIGAADHYESRPEDMFDLLAKAGLRIYPLSQQFFRKHAYTRAKFILCYEQKEEYYFVAAG